MKLNSMREMQFNDDVTSALGVRWFPDEDVFRFSFQPPKDHITATKRSLLSIVSLLFDPMGLLSPVIIQAKILLQSLWLKKCNWDDELPPEIHKEWTDILISLETLPSVKISRYICIPNKVNAQLHGFGDASIKAYGCCLYIRSEDSLGNVAVNLLASKTRVAPLKQHTLPRLELCAAHLLATFWHQLQSHLNCPLSKVYLWSDSQLTLHWLKSHSSKLSTFVGNRVAEIQEITSNCSWRYVPTQFNPADLVSRGCSAFDLNSFWLNGPEFLLRDASDWPDDFRGYLSKADLEAEERKTTLGCTNNVLPHVLQRIHSISSFTKCLRVFAYAMRLKYRQKNITVTASEMNIALHRIILIIQQHYYGTEIRSIEKGQPIKKLLRSLNLFMDHAGGLPILRVGGRLVNSDLAPSTKYPALLPKEDFFSKVIASHIHRSNFHADPHALTAMIQQQFWITNLRDLANQIVKNFIFCTRYRPKLLTQIMGSLPKERVTGHRAFEVVGEDFAGPIATYLKIPGKRPYKSYIAVFVCFATKAAHLEAVSELSTNAFLASLKRFVSRRGLPSKIFCDNATNFVGADRKL